MLSEIRESGSVEQDADVILRDSFYDKHTNGAVEFLTINLGSYTID